MLGKGEAVQIFGTSSNKSSSIQQEIKSILKAGNACSHPV